MNWSQQHPQLKVPAGLEASQHALTTPAGKKPKPALATLGKKRRLLGEFTEPRRAPSVDMPSSVPASINIPLHRRTWWPDMAQVQYLGNY